MSGHGVVSKHSPAAAGAATDEVGPIQKWKRNEREGRQREKRRDNGHIGHIELAAIMWDRRTHTNTHGRKPTPYIARINQTAK